MDTALFAAGATVLVLAALGLTRGHRSTRATVGWLLTAALLVPVTACGAQPPESPRSTAPLSLPTTTRFVPPPTTTSPPPDVAGDLAPLITPTTTVTPKPPNPPAPPAVPAPPPAPTSSAAPIHVTAGAFCATAGATGISKAGKAMVCAPARDGRLRWQQA